MDPYMDAITKDTNLKLLHEFTNLFANIQGMCNQMFLLHKLISEYVCNIASSFWNTEKCNFKLQKTVACRIPITLYSGSVYSTVIILQDGDNICDFLDLPHRCTYVYLILSKWQDSLTFMIGIRILVTLLLKQLSC